MKQKQKIIGTLVPLSALWSSKQKKIDYGTFESGCYFLNWLQKTGQSAWQLLPLHEPQLEEGSAVKHIPSPYKSYGIGLSPDYLPSSFKEILPAAKEYEKFTALHTDWIYDYALFCSLRDHFGTDDWKLWDEDIRSRKKKAILLWQKKYADKIKSYIIKQWQLHKAYSEMRGKAKKMGIYLMGDIPFYISCNSPLVWAHQKVFLLTNFEKLRFVSGIPNSYFGRQVWGHPLFNWRSKTKVFNFWKMRVNYVAQLFDMVRIDHAKAFFWYGVIDLENASNDRFRKGPGEDFFKALYDYSNDLNLQIYAEDTGDKIRSLRKNLSKLKIPGIKLFRFALDEKKNKLIKQYIHISDYPKNTVVYASTHDTDTLLGYLQILTPEQKITLARVTQVPYSEDVFIFARRLRQALIDSPAKYVIVQMQDWLLTTDRINIPGTEKAINDSNWRYQINKPIEEFNII